MKTSLKVLVWAAALLCVVHSTPAAPAVDPRTGAAGLVRLNDKEFLDGFFFYLTEATRANPALPASDAWLVLRRLETMRTNSTDQISHSLHMSYVAWLIARNGSQADLAQLLDFADQLPAEGFHRRYMMNALLDFAARLEVEKLNGRQIDVKFPRHAPGFTPHAVPAVTPALADAANLFNAARALHPPEPTNAWLSAQANWGFFYDTIGQLLRRKLTNASQQMLQFKWGGWCGTGSDMFEMPQSRALFIALLQERQYDGALGAVLNIGHDGWTTLPMFNDELPWKRAFISQCGLDWEMLYAGEVASGSPWHNGGGARAIARFGSEKGAHLLADMAMVPTISDSREYLLSIGAFIGPTELRPTTNASGTITFNTHWSQFDYVRALSNALPSALQLDLLNILSGKLREPNLSAEVAETVTWILAELRRPEAIPVLREALKLSYAKVQQTAASALNDLGEHVQVPAPLPPIAFKIVANGKPLANSHVEFELRMTGGRGLSSTRVTDSNGTLLLDRDVFVDKQYVVTNVTFTAQRLKAPGEPWFEIHSRPPVDLLTPHTLQVDLRPLTLQVKTAFPLSRITDQQARLYLRAERHRTYGIYMDGVSDEIVVPFSTNIVFPSLQPGRYELELRVPGAANWKSGEIQLKENSATVTASLNPGADVRYTITTPNDPSPFNQPSFEILRAGQRVDSYLYVDWQAKICRGLPAGEYTFRVLSRAEQQAQQSRGSNEKLINVRGYRGAERSFTIRDDSPNTMELGVIELPAEK